MEFTNPEEALFCDLVSSDAEKFAEESIKHSIESNEFLNDLLNSGAVGKISDFVQMYGEVGQVKYDYANINIKGNYSQGLSIMDKYLLSMPVRASIVNVQNHLGTDGGKLREMSVLSSRVKFSGEDKCGCKPLSIRLDYDVYLNGDKLTNKYMIDVGEDRPICDIIDTLIHVNENEDVSKYQISGRFLQNLINSYDLTTLFGQPLEFKLEKFYKDFIGIHYVKYKGKEMLGSSVLDEMERNHERICKVYSMYSCTSNKGICNRCYGVISPHLSKQDFMGNIGINTVFNIGEEKFQATLDSAKNTKKKKVETTSNLFDLFTVKSLSSMQPVITGDFAISKVDVDTFKILKGDSGKAFGPLIDGAEFDTDYIKKRNVFIPNCLVNFDDVNGNTEHMERVYIKYLKYLTRNISVRPVESILSINTNYMIGNWHTEDPKEETEDKSVDEVGELTIDILPMQEVFNTGDYSRYWLSKPKVIGETDVITSLCLGSAFERMFLHATGKKKYDPLSVYSDKFSFEKMESSIKTSTIYNSLATLLPDEEEDSIENITIKEPVKKKIVVDPIDAQPEPQTTTEEFKFVFSEDHYEQNYSEPIIQLTKEF